MIFLNKYPSIIIDKTQKRVVNYSSPHPYTFHTGEVLPACSDEVARETKLEAHHIKEKNDKGWLDVNIRYGLSHMQKKELMQLSILDEVDIILVPYPVLNCLKQFGDNMYNPKIMKKVRVCKLDDRVTKVIRSDEFCV